ncbi:4813_t:CDS:2, partial [Paraglomus brasilianum]
QLAKATPTSKRVLNEQEDLDAGAEDEREEGEDGRNPIRLRVWHE